MQVRHRWSILQTSAAVGALGAELGDGTAGVVPLRYSTTARLRQRVASCRAVPAPLSTLHVQFRAFRLPNAPSRGDCLSCV